MNKLTIAVINDLEYALEEISRGVFRLYKSNSRGELIPSGSLIEGCEKNLTEVALVSFLRKGK